MFFVRSAERFAASENYPLAIDLYRKALNTSRSPSVRGELHLKIAGYLQIIHKDLESVQEYNRALLHLPGKSRRSGVLEIIGDTLMRMKRCKNAERRYREVLVLVGRKDPRAGQLKAKICGAQAHQLSDEGTQFEKKKALDNAFAAYMRAYQLVKDLQPQFADRMLKQSAAILEKKMKWIMISGDRWVNKGEPKKALHCFNKAIELMQDLKGRHFPGLYALLKNKLLVLEKGEVEERGMTHCLMAEIDESLGSYDSALGLYERAAVLLRQCEGGRAKGLTILIDFRQGLIFEKKRRVSIALQLVTIAQVDLSVLSRSNCLGLLTGLGLHNTLIEVIERLAKKVLQKANRLRLAGSSIDARLEYNLVSRAYLAIGVAWKPPLLNTNLSKDLLDPGFWG